MLRRNVTKSGISRQNTEEGDSVTNQHRYPRNRHPLNQARSQEPLNRISSVDIQVASASGFQLGNDFRWRPGHLFHNSTLHITEIQWPAAEDHHPLLTVRPLWKGQNGFEVLRPMTSVSMLVMNSL